MTSSIRNGSQTGSCTFIVNNDKIPEANETYAVSIKPRSGAVVGEQNTTFVTILLNDDPYGYIGFSKPAQTIDVKEPVKSHLTLYLNLTRYGGLVNNVGILWEVCSICLYIKFFYN